MIMTRPPLFAFALVVWCQLPSTAYATIAEHLTLPELVGRADLVVLGQPLTATSYWRDGRIYTRTQFLISETWAGNVASTARSATPQGDQIAIVSLGGIVDAIGQQVMGVAALTPQQRTVVCLRQNADHATYTVVGMALGAFYVDDSVPISNPPVYQILDELHTVSIPTFTPTTSARDVPAPTSLATLRQAVQEAAHAQ